MQPLGAFVLVFLQAQIKSTCISHNSFLCIFHEAMYNKTIIEFGFCDIRNNQGLGKCNQPQPPASADYTCLDVNYSGYHRNLIQLLFLIYSLQAPLHPCKKKEDCHENAECHQGKCHCLRKTVGNGKYCEGNIVKRSIVKSAD